MDRFWHLGNGVREFYFGEEGMSLRWASSCLNLDPSSEDCLGVSIT
jgi:hypothetical protein